MSRKINLNKLIEKMNKRFPEGSLNEIEKARYLYIELGKLLKFDINYISSSERKSEDVYWKPVNFDKIEDNEFICRQIAEMYAELLNRAGLNAKRHYRTMGEVIDEYFDPTCKHAYTVIKLQDGRKFIADLVYDLPFIQGGMNTLFFGEKDERREDIVLINQDEVREIDKKIGYSYPVDLYKSAYVYTNEFYKMIKEDLENPERLKEYIDATYPETERSDILTRYKLDAITRFVDTSKMGFREGRMFLERLFGEFFSKEERERITMSNLITENEREHYYGPTKMMECFTFDRGDGMYDYYMYVPGNKLERMSKEKIKVMMNIDSYVPISKKEEIPGFEDR